MAHRALMLSSLGAARAALRALQADDFDDQERAEELLGVLRDSNATPDEGLAAVKALIALAPSRGFLTPTPTLRSGGRSRGTRSG